MTEPDYGYGHYSEWQPLTKVLRWARGMRGMPDCCYCRRPVTEMQARRFVLTTRDINQIPMCGCPPPQFRCAPGKGCNAAPWSRAGAYLRSLMWDGPPSFYRPRDKTYWSVAE